MKKVCFYGLPLVISFGFITNVSAKSLDDYVFPPLEKMENSAEDRYYPNTYMSYSNHQNSSFFQQSDYVFPKLEKSVQVKPTYPSDLDYSSKKTDESDSLNLRSPLSTLDNDNKYDVKNYKLSRPTGYSSINKYKSKYPNYSSNNDFFDMNSWNPLNGRFMPGLGNSSIMKMPNFF